MDSEDLASLANLKYNELLKIAKEKTGTSFKKRLSKVKLIELVRASMMLMSDDEDDEVKSDPVVQREEIKPEPMEESKQSSEVQPKRKKPMKAKRVLKTKSNKLDSQQKDLEETGILESTFTVNEKGTDNLESNVTSTEAKAEALMPSRVQTKIPKLARRAPNFAQLHQKNFDKMQSVDDYIEKKKMRTATLTSSTKPNRIRPVLNTPNSSVKVQPLKFDFTSGADKPIFLARGEVAVQKKRVFATVKENFGSVMSESRPGPSKAILSTKATIGNTSEKSRTLLKGVRTNRRFELLMKHRESRKSAANN